MWEEKGYKKKKQTPSGAIWWKKVLFVFFLVININIILIINLFFFLFPLFAFLVLSFLKANKTKQKQTYKINNDDDNKKQSVREREEGFLTKWNNFLFLFLFLSIFSIFFRIKALWKFGFFLAGQSWFQHQHTDFVQKWSFFHFYSDSFRPV